jgi:hypothetical protein
MFKFNPRGLNFAVYKDMKQNPLKIILKSLLVVLATISAAVVAFLFSQGGILRSEFTHQKVAQVDAATFPENGPPCNAALVDGDVYQGRRLDIDVPNLGINQTAEVDVAQEYNKTCLNGLFSDEELHGGFSTATIEYDVNNLLNSWATMDRALAQGAPEGIEGMKEGFELMEVAVWDGDLETNPHAADDFPFSCNSIYSRRREGRRDDGQPRIQDRASLGSYCCANGWGTEEYLYNPAEAHINEGADEFDGGFKNWFENSPEPDADGDPRNGYSGTMTGHYTLRWDLTDQAVDITFEKIPATHMMKNFTFFLPWPGLLFKHLTPTGQGLDFYQNNAVRGFMTDSQKGNGVWDGADAPAGNCDASKAIPLPGKEWDDNKDGKNWVEPIAYPCPPGTPEYDNAGHFAWYHDEPFVDENNNGKYDDGEPFQDTGNGYGPSDESGGADTWTYDAGSGSIDNTVAPELTFNRQLIDFADTPSPKSNGLPYAPITRFYPLTNIHIRGVFEAYTQTQCNCRPDDRLDEGVSPSGQPYHGCQATFGDFFDPTACGFCGSNQPILNGGSSENSLNARGYQQAYCEDSVPRTTDVRWPPFTLSTTDFRWELSSSSVGELFDTVLKDTGNLPSINIATTPLAPAKGDSVNVLAIPISFFQTPQNMYFAWTINGLSEQGIVAGAEERVDEHKAPPDFTEIAPPSPELPSGATFVHKETRQFYFAPKRTPKNDSNGDGMDDAWEMRYFGKLDVNPVADPDADGFAAKDFASIRPSIFVDGEHPQSKATYAQQGRFIYITPGVWWTKNGRDTFIPPEDFNPEWFPGPDVAPGLTNIEEYVWGTNPTDPDTDDDGFPDGADLVGVGQMSWSYTNQIGATDANRDKVGVIVMGKGNAANQQTAEPLTQIVCVDKTVYPAANDNLGLTLNFTPSIPAPGEELRIQALSKNPDIKEGFLTYDWKINGVDKVSGGQGQNELVLSANDTKSLVSGQLLRVEVTAYNNNPHQGSYGAVGTTTTSIPIGVAYDSLEVKQNDKTIFPFPSDQVSDQTRIKALTTQLKNGIDINRSDDVSIAITNVWSNEVANNLYFEWKVDDLVQNGKNPGKGSGTGSGYTNFTFNPQSFLPNGLTSEDAYPKNIEVIGRAVDINTQKEVFNIDLKFNYAQPGISVSESGEGDSSVALSADIPQTASIDGLYYNWKIAGKTVAEGKGKSKIKLSYLQASTAPIVELTVSNIGGVVTHEVTASTKVHLSKLSLTLKQRIAYSIYGFFMKVPHSTLALFYDFLIANAVFLVLFGLYSVNRGKSHERQS